MSQNLTNLEVGNSGCQRFKRLKPPNGLKKTIEAAQEGSVYMKMPEQTFLDAKSHLGIANYSPRTCQKCYDVM